MLTSAYHLLLLFLESLVTLSCLCQYRNNFEGRILSHLGVLLGGEIGPSKTRDVVGQDSQAKQGYICGLKKI